MKYVSSGNFGDLIHQLYLIRELHKKTRIKGELYLKDGSDPKLGNFERGSKNVINEISEFIISQGYISKIETYHENLNLYIDLDKWRYNGKFYKKCWTEMLSDTYNLRYPEGFIYPWITTDKVDNYFIDKIIIHESDLNYRRFDSFPWEAILKNNNCIFVSFDERQYRNFKFKNLVPFFKLDDFEHCAIVLNSCKFYVGNLTSITAIARAMSVPSLVQLYCESYLDGYHYIGEKKYWNNFFYISEIDDIKNIDKLYLFLKWY